MTTSPRSGAKTTSALSSLKLVTAPVKATASVDPVVTRRNAMVARLQEQLELVKNPNFKKVLKHRQKDEEGKTVYTTTEHKVHPFWTAGADGSVVFSILFQFKPIEIAKGLTGIHVPSFEKLPETIAEYAIGTKKGA
jgi:hypothetical protein